ncbi:hypothetical protein D3C72_822110 [compost metagenome]
MRLIVWVPDSAKYRCVPLATAPAGLFRPVTAGVGFETSLAASTLRSVPSVESRNSRSSPFKTMPEPSRLTPSLAA